MVEQTERIVGVCSFLHGFLVVTGTADAIISVDFTTEQIKEVQGVKEVAKAVKQLSEYANKRRTTFELNIQPDVTPFFKEVYQELSKIPYGELWTYKDIAHAIGRPKAARAVGMAMNKNPCMIIWPCHRVVGVNRKLVGFAGGIDFKVQLLEFEGVNLDGYR
ncbi:MAG TPA: cysteine methyltransferase [Erysipelotrichaceae bacterium]|nr:cysteine methyltransferase [Erysipelotrichaceae bacterium]